uniref:Minor structural protein n=1 Tax=Rousettus madagascariensis sapovirus 2 TaxID=3144122 RepID=A0AAU7E2N7_9CALI
MMGSWATGAMLGASAAGDLVTGFGNLILSAINTSNQIQVQKRQLQLAQQQLELLDKTSNPNTIFKDALANGFDPVSARQLAGSAERRFVGATPLPPITNSTYLALNGTRTASTMLAANSAFVNGIRPTRPPSTRLPGFANLNYEGFGRSPSLSSASSSLTLYSSLGTRSNASTVSYSSLPGK